MPFLGEGEGSVLTPPFSEADSPGNRKSDSLLYFIFPLDRLPSHCLLEPPPAPPGGIVCGWESSRLRSGPHREARTNRGPLYRFGAPGRCPRRRRPPEGCTPPRQPTGQWQRVQPWGWQHPHPPPPPPRCLLCTELLRA
ncbi:hypothetical protein HJG60_008528 [Phyllostomus discolor]|uniref:Uncharacterized protein n=1 Tax=Phyllostomus discolor TaxID=89673 RepID=A0A833YZ54_9CHIR|nr:hypothetical protein HJG60_008528 [Phyllostomus discolor]